MATKTQQFQLWASISTVIALIMFGISFGTYKQKVDDWDRNFKGIADQVMTNSNKTHDLEVWKSETAERLSQHRKELNAHEDRLNLHDERLGKLEMRPIPVFSRRGTSIQ